MMQQGGPPSKELIRWPLVQQFYSRESLPAVNPGAELLPDARLINAYGELIIGSKSEYQVFKRPGLGPPLPSLIIGLPGGTYSYNVPNTNGTTDIFTIVNGALFVNNVPILGFTMTPGQPATFETIQGTLQTIMIMGTDITGSNTSGWIYTPSTSTLAQITDPTFVAIRAVPGIAYLNGWIYVMDVQGTIWNTQNQFNAAVWNALNTIQATNYADQGVYLARQLSYVIAIKQWNTQIFYDAGAQISGQGSPLGVVPDALIPYGCVHAFTVAKVDETLIWVTTNRDLQAQVLVLDNLTPTIVSTPSVERILKTFQAKTGPNIFPLTGYSTGVYSWALKLAGHRLYGLTLPSMNVTMVFDIDQKLWYFWTDANGNFWPYSYFTYTQPNFTAATPGTQYMQHVVTGVLYPLDDMYTYPTDNGAVFPVDIYTPVTDFGTLRVKLLNDMYFDTDITKSNKMLARYTDNDYQSFSNFREVQLNVNRPSLSDEGSFERRAYHFRHQLATSFRIRSTGLDLDVGIL